MKKGYEKWERGGGGGGGGGVGGGGGGGGGPATWPARDRDREREQRERQARVHQQMSHVHPHAAEPDASSLFQAPVRVTGNRDRVSQQINLKLGDYSIAQTLLDDPSKSIGICAEPPSPAPCHPSRRESEFKKPSHAPQNGRVHYHRPYYNKSDAPGSTGPPAPRPPPVRIPNGYPPQNAIDSSQPPIESILKEMKSLPTQISLIAATPRKELENKFIFNPHTNKVQENPQLTNNIDLKTPISKPGLDNRISNSRSSVSPANKEISLLVSDEDEASSSTRLEPILSPIGSGGSPSSASGDSSPSDSESESSSAPSSPRPAAAPAPVDAPAAPAAGAEQSRHEWSLRNFVQPPIHHDQPSYPGKELRHALDDVKGKPRSPISELSDSETSSPSPAPRVRRPASKRASPSSDDESPPTHSSPQSVSAAAAGPLKRGRPPKLRAVDELGGQRKRPRGRPPKHRPTEPEPPAPSAPLAPHAPPPPAPSAPAPERQPEPEVHTQQLQDTKTFIFRKVFTPRKGDEGGGKGGKGGKGKGGKGKGQVTIIEVGADEEERRARRHEEALERVSPPKEHEPTRRHDRGERLDRSLRADQPERSERNERIERPDRIERLERTERFDRSERTDLNERSDRQEKPERVDRPDRPEKPDRSEKHDRPDRPERHDRLDYRIPDRRSVDRIATDKHSDRYPEPMSVDRIQERLKERIQERVQERMTDRLAERFAADKSTLERLTNDKQISVKRISGDKLSTERVASDKIVSEKLPDRVNEKAISERSNERSSKMCVEKTYVKAEADVGLEVKQGRGSERLEAEASSNVVVGGRGRGRLMVRVPLERLSASLRRALARAPPARVPRHAPAPHQCIEVAATNHERTDGGCGGLAGGAGLPSPVYYSYFERQPADSLSNEDKDHEYYLREAVCLRAAADAEPEPLAQVMLLLESVLCFVLTGRVLELDLDSKKAFTVYRETVEYIKTIHSMPQRFRASPHSTFNKLDILILRVQSLLYRRMFKMYDREVKEYHKIAQEYHHHQKSSTAEGGVVGASPLSPTPSPAGSVGSLGSGGSSGYLSSGGAGGAGAMHAVPAHAHHALLQLTKYYTFLYVAHELWEQADELCKLPPNQDLFIAVDRKCGPLSLFSSFCHLVKYVRHAISLLKSTPRE